MLIENNETFLSELSKLFASNQTKGGSLYVTMKKYDGRTKPEPRKDVSAKYKGKMLPTKRKQTASESESEHKCLIRASLGGKKISTVISSRDVNKFQLVSICDTDA